MSKRILVVEDEEDNRRIVRDLLTSVGYEIIEAVTGEEGVKAAETHLPDLILMDIQLPGLDGYEATRQIKANPALRHIPIIVVTSYALSGDDVRHSRLAVMPISPSPSAHARSWPRFASTCRSEGTIRKIPLAPFFSGGNRKAPFGFQATLLHTGTPAFASMAPPLLPLHTQHDASI